MRSLLIRCSFLLLLAACSTPSPTTGEGDYQVTPITPEVIKSLQSEQFQRDGSSSAGNQATQYKLGAGDILLFRIFTAPGVDALTNMREAALTPVEQTNTITVQEDGSISLPYAGMVRVGGQTVAEAIETIRQAFSQYFKKPQVSVEIKEFNSRKVFIMGEVSKPSFQILKTGSMSIAEALTASQGLNSLTAQYKQIYVIRGAMHNTIAPAGAANVSPMSTTIYQLDASNGTGMAMSAQFPLKADDVIYVSPTVVSEWSKVINQALPFSLSNAANVSRQY